MPTQLQLRRGTTTEHSTFSGAVGEVTVDTTKDTLVVHDGATNGGFPLAKEAGATFGNTNVTGNFSFADNAKAQFGAGSDLQIYHDGNNSIINDAGTGSLKFQYGGTDGVVFDSTGNVGIGVSPTQKLDVAAGGKLYLRRSDNTTGATIHNGGNTVGLVLEELNNEPIAFKQSGTERMRITSGGSLLVGTSSAVVSGNTFGLEVKNALPAIFMVDSTATSLTYGGVNFYRPANAAGNGNGFSFGLNNSSSVYAEYGYIGAVIEDNTAAAQDGSLLFATTLNNTRTERVRITSAGNVGIGTISPSQKLTIYGDGGSFANTAAISFWDVNSGGSRRWAIANGASATGISQIGALTFNVGSGSFTDDPLSSGIEVMRMMPSGVIGIGVTSPTNSLDTSGKIRVRDVGTTTVPSIQMGASGVDGLSLPATNTIAFITNNTEHMRIDSNGKVLINSTSPNYAEYLKVDALSGGYAIHTIKGSTASEGHFVFSNPNGAVGTIFTNGTSTSYNTSSDYRLKENVTADWDATTRLKQLNPVRFNFIADPDTTVDGFIAHEVQDVVPEAIHGTKDAMRDEEYEVSAATGDIYTPAIEAVLDEDGNEVTPAVAEVIHSTDVERPEELAEGQQWRETTPAVMGTRSVPDYQGIDQSKLVPLLVKTIQELEARIAALEAN